MKCCNPDRRITTRAIARAGALSIILSTPTTVLARQTAGRVLFAFREAVAIDVDGNQRWLVKGDSVHVGETLKTLQGKIQIRLVDGGSLALGRFTRARINAHLPGDSDSGDDGVVISLISGDIRGTLGRNADHVHLVESAFATAEIRAMSYHARLCRSTDCLESDGTPKTAGLYVQTTQGAAALSSEHGELECGSPHACFVHDLKSPGAVDPDVSMVLIDARAMPIEHTGAGLVSAGAGPVSADTGAGLPADRDPHPTLRPSPFDLGSFGLSMPSPSSDTMERFGTPSSSLPVAGGLDGRADLSGWTPAAPAAMAPPGTSATIPQATGAAVGGMQLGGQTQHPPVSPTIGNWAPAASHGARIGN